MRRIQFGRLSLLILFLCAWQLMLPYQLLAQTVPGQTSPPASQPVTAHPAPTPFNLDLRATAATLTPGNLVGSHPVAINVGGHALNVTQSSMLTPAERLAVYQVVSTGHQSLLLGGLGNAVGGSFNIGPNFSRYVSSLVVPHGVTAIQNAAAAASLNLAGNLTNAGAFYLVSTSPGATRADISARNIFNQQGAMISSVLPAAGLPGISGTISNLSLSLTAIDNIVNAGVIRSAGSLTLTAGNSIANALPAGASGPAPVMQAATALNLITNQLVNTGTISSLTGNISLAGMNAGSLAVANTGGTLQALLGSINVRDSLFAGNANFDLTGGSLLSKDVNVFCGSGVANINADAISGLLNIHAGEAHTQVNSGTLNMGTLCLSGDPTFYNTAGSVTIGGNLSFAGDNLAIVARGDISTAADNLTISTSNSSKGGAITLIAGANFTSDGAPSNPATFPIQSSDGGDQTSTLTITGGSSTGGKIDLATHPITSLNASSSAGAGGNVTLVAFGGATNGAGSIFLPANVDINTAGATANGNVTVIAGGASVNTSGGARTAISLGGINTAGTGTGGDVTIAAANPTVPASHITVQNGAMTGTFGTGTVASNGNIVINSNLVAGGTVTITANGSGSILTPNKVIADPTLTSVNLPHNQLSQLYPFGAALTPNGSFAYVPNNDDNSVSVIDTSSNTVVATINLGSGTVTSLLGYSVSSPKGAAVSPDGSSVYVVCNSSVAGQGAVVVINTSTQAVTTAYAFKDDGTHNTSFDPQLVAVAPNGNLYVLSDYAAGIGSNSTTGLGNVATVPNQVTVINPANPSNVTTISLTGGFGKAINLGGIAVNPQGTLAYVANTGSNNVSVIDLATNKLLSTITLPSSSAMLPNVLDLQNHTLVYEPVPFEPVALSFNPSGTRLYVGQSAIDSNFSEGRVLSIDTLASSSTFNQVLSQSSLVFGGDVRNGLGFLPQAMTVTPTGTQLFVPATYYPLGTVFTPITLQLLETPSLGGNAAVNAPDGYGSNTFSAIVTNSGVNNVQTYVADPTHFNGNPSVFVVQVPTIQGAGISLHSGTGNIFVNYDAEGGTFTATTGGTGSVIAGNVGTSHSTSSIGASSAGGIFQIGALNGLNVTGAIIAPQVIVQTTANNGAINVGGVIGKTGATVQLLANGSGAITESTGGSVVGSALTLTSASGDIGASGRSLKTQAGSIIAQTSGAVFLSNTGALTTLRETAGNGFTLSNTASLTVTSNWLLDSNNISLTASAGSITLSTQLGNGAPGSTISLEADGTGSITQTAGAFTIAADTVNLTIGTGSLGSTAVPLRTVATTISILNTSASGSGGSAYVSNTGNLTLASDWVGGTLSLVTSGSLSLAFTTVGSTQPLNISLKTTGTGNNIDIESAIGNVQEPLFGGGSTVVLNAAGQITNNITTTNGVINGKSVTLINGSGDIGSTNNPILLHANALAIEAFGNAYFNATASDQSPGLVLNPSRAGGTLRVVTDAGGQIIVNGALQAQTVDLEATNVLQNAGTITASGLILVSTDGTIGTASSPIKSATSNLSWTFNQSGTVANPALSLYLSNTGSLDLDPASSNGNSVNITSAGNITDNNKATIFASSVALTATGTNVSIGSSSNNILMAEENTGTGLNVVNLTAKASGGVFINGLNGATSAPVTVALPSRSACGAGGSSGFNLSASGDIRIDPLATITVANGPISLTAGTANSSGSTDIIQSSGGTALIGSTVALSAQNGSIGPLGAPIGIRAGTLSLSASSGGQINVAVQNQIISSTVNMTVSPVASIGITAASPVNLSSAGNINALVQSSVVTSPVTLTVLAGGDVAIHSYSPIKLSGLSSADTSSGTGGFSLSAVSPPSGLFPPLVAASIVGSISFLPGAEIAGPSVSLTTANKGSITQTAQGTSIVSPTISLLADTTTAGSASAIGSTMIPIGIGSGKAGTPASLTAGAASNIFVSGSTAVTLTGASSVSNASGKFSLIASGNILLDTRATVTSKGTLILTADGAGSSITQSDSASTTTLFAPAIALTAGTGSGADIGSSTSNPVVLASPVSPQTVNLTLRAGDSAFVSAASGTGTVNANLVATSTSVNQLSLQASGNVTFAPAAQIKVTTPGTGSITIQPGGGFNITQAAPGITMSAPNISLVADASGNSGSIGGVVPIGVASGTSGAVQLSAAAGLNVSVSATGSMTLLGTSTANNGFFKATATNGINVGTPGSSSTIAGATGLTLIASGSLGIVESDPANPTTLAAGTGSTVALTSSTGPIGGLSPASAVLVSESSGPALLTLSAHGTARVSSDTTLSVASATAGGVFLSTTGTGNGITLTGNVTAGSSGVQITTGAQGTFSIASGKTLTSTSGPVAIMADNLEIGGTNFGKISAGAGTVGITSVTAGNQILVGGTSITKPDALNITGDAGSIDVLGGITAGGLTIGLTGTSAGPNSGGITIAGNIAIPSSGAGSYSLNFQTSGSYNASNETIATGARMLTVNAGGDVNTGTITGSSATVAITSGGSNGISVGGPITMTSAGSVQLTAGGNGSISNSNTAPITARSLALQTSGGNIGTSGSPLYTAALVLSANAGGNTATVDISNKGGTAATPVVLSSSSSGGAFSLTNTGDLTVNDITTNSQTSSSNGSINLIADSGALRINSTTSGITASGGDITIQNLNTSTGIISIGSSPAKPLTLHASSTAPGAGTVTIAIGPVAATLRPIQPNPPKLVVNATPPGAAEQGGSGFALASSVTASAPVTLNALGTNLTISNGSPAASHITLSGNVTITADPPGAGVLSRSPATLSSGTPPVTAAPLQTLNASKPALRAPEVTAAPGASGAVFPQTPQVNTLVPTDRSRNFDVQAGLTFAGADLGADEVMIFDHNGLRPGPGRQGAAAPGTFSLKNGSVLFAPERALVVRTPHGQVVVAAGAIALVAVSKDGIAVYDLHDGRCGDVTISTGGHSYPLFPGRHVMVSRSQGEYGSVNPITCIAHANMEAVDITGGGRLFRSRFSMASVVTELQPVLALRRSADPRDRKLAEKLIKNAAIFMQTKTPPAPYRRISASG